MRLTPGQLGALLNLAHKKAGLQVGWIVIADALGLTDLGFAARNRSERQESDRAAHHLPRSMLPRSVLGGEPDKSMPPRKSIWAKAGIAVPSRPTATSADCHVRGARIRGGR